MILVSDYRKIKDQRPKTKDQRQKTKDKRQKCGNEVHLPGGVRGGFCWFQVPCSRVLGSGSLPGEARGGLNLKKSNK
jgi:hypothetical protein